MILAEKDLWEIVEGSEERPEASANPTEIKAFERRSNKAFATLVMNLKDSQLAHIQACKSPAEAWKTLCDVHETKGLANILFLRRRFFTVKMQEGEDILAHINMVKGLADQLNCVEVPVTEGDIVMTLLESLPPSFESLIVALEARPMKELTIDFVSSRLIHEASRRKENENHKEDAALLMRHHKGATSNDDKKVDKVCFYCKKPGHFARNCYKKKSDEREKANHAKFDDVEHDYVFMAGLSVSIHTRQDWLVDSGATQHMTFQRHWFESYEEIEPRKVFMGDDTILEAIGRGNIVTSIKVEGVLRQIKITKVLHVPKIHNNLLSVSKLISEGLKIEFGEFGCVMRNKLGNVIATATRDKNLFRLDCLAIRGNEKANAAKLEHGGVLALWHRRLGHLNLPSVQNLETLVTGMDLNKEALNPPHPVCKGCIEGKQHRIPFPKEGGTRSSEILGLVHTDVCGPMKTTSMGGARYFVTFIDDKTRRISVYFLKTKGECFKKFKHYMALAEKQTGKDLKVLRSDNGGEFVSKNFGTFLGENGIARQTSTPYTPQQNGVAERANRTIVEMARSMLHAQNIGLELWAEAVSCAVYIRNRCPTTALDSMTPEEAWTGVKPCIAHLKVFGCYAYAHVPQEKRTKFDAKAIKCLFLGYCEGTKAYRLLSLESNKILKSRDVIFCEVPEVGSDLKIRPSGRDDVIQGIDVVVDDISKSKMDEVVTSESIEEDDNERQEIDEADNVLTSTREQRRHANKREHQIGHRKSTREKRAPGEWWKNHLLPDNDAEQANVAMFDEPQTIKEALSCANASKWEQALHDEYNSLIANDTWTLTPLPKDRHAIGCKWVFRRKRNADGDVQRYKARLVAKGYSQTYGVDFNETFVPVAKFTTIRCILAIGATENMEIHQMDVKTAFLKGELEEEIYMQQPQGFVKQGEENLVCKLKKTLYGLKQSPRAWYQKIDKFLVDFGF